MKPYSNTDKTILGYVTILSGILALTCMILGMVATRFDPEAFSNPVKILEISGLDLQAIRWFMLTDMLGYYLMLLPALFYLHRKLETKTPWAALFTSFGFLYILIGAIGAAILAVVWPSLILQHELAPLATKEIYKADFLMITDLVVKALWNTLEVLLSGIWWIGIGVFLIENRALKIVTLILGLGCLIDAIGELFQIPLMAEIGLNVYLVLAIVWPVWLGASIIRNKI